MKKEFTLVALALFACVTINEAMANNTMKRLPESQSSQADARHARTLYLNAENGKIAYRTLGIGKPMILCNRFRGTLDTWDPAFLDELAKKHKVIIFDYPGIGLSSGQLPHNILEVARSVKNVASVLKIKRFNLMGWSYGGAVAQTYAANFGDNIDNLIIIGANPPGKNGTPLEKAFLDAAFKPFNDLKDDEVLFFEPSIPASVRAAKVSRERIASRKRDLSKPVTPEKFDNYFKGAEDYQADSYGSRTKLATAPFPILVLSGDHDPSCPIENWYPIIRQWKSAQFHVIGSTGHGVQHEFPIYSVKLINLFLGGLKG
jgi:pimeloyl-ACP methyl ester carboxylesterase